MPRTLNRGGQYRIPPHQVVGFVPGQPGGPWSMRGGNFWNDFQKGFTGTLDVASKALPFLPLLGLGKKKRRQRGGRRAPRVAPMRSRVIEA